MNMEEKEKDKGQKKKGKNWVLMIKEEEEEVAWSIDSISWAAKKTGGEIWVWLIKRKMRGPNKKVKKIECGW